MGAVIGACPLVDFGLKPADASVTARARPGALVRYEPMTAYLLPVVTMPAKAYRITYRSTDAMGRPNVVSGVVLVPNAQYRGDGEKPLLGYAIG